MLSLVRVYPLPQLALLPLPLRLPPTMGLPTYRFLVHQLLVLRQVRWVRLLVRLQLRSCCGV